MGVKPAMESEKAPRENEKAPESSPDDVGPGAALDELVERELEVRPGEPEPGISHAAAEAHEAAGPEPSEHSYWPVVLAVASLLIGVGFLTHPAVSVVGVIVAMWALVGWFTEPWVS